MWLRIQLIMLGSIFAVVAMQVDQKDTQCNPPCGTLDWFSTIIWYLAIASIQWNNYICEFYVKYKKI